MKNNPIRPPSSEFGLIAWLEKTRIALPLKGVECRFHVTGVIASVELDQIFHQEADRPLDCSYVFPLPAGAAVYRCEIHVNGRVIRAKVEEQARAREIFRQQTAAGHRAALVESERENLFTLSLGNVQPSDLVVVRFAWFQVLDRTGAGLRLLIPTCPGVRYIPGAPLLRAPAGRGTAGDTGQVPDASRISPPRIDALHPDAAYFSLSGRLGADDVAPGSVSSPSHPIVVRDSEGLLQLALFGLETVPDRDVVVTWREPAAKHLVPQAWHWNEDGDTYALVQLRAPDGVGRSDDFAQDFYFLVDRSGSMAGRKWQRTCEALRAFVGLLGPLDRVAITLFESGLLDFADEPLPASVVLADRGFKSMEALGTGGGTELLPAVRHVLERIRGHSGERRATVVLITDGEVGNEVEITRAFLPQPAVTVHTFGIDTTVNDAFLKALAGQQRGACCLQTPDDDIAGSIAALGDRLRRPVLTDLTVRSGWESGRRVLPDLHAGEVVTVALRGRAGVPLEIFGRQGDGREHGFKVDLGRAGHVAIRLLWARERIAALLAAGQGPEARDCARRHNLICAGMAFIAWDEQERVEIAADHVVQPALRPASGFAPLAAPRRSAPRGVGEAPLADLDPSAGGLCESIRDRPQAGKTRSYPKRLDAVRAVLEAERVPDGVIGALLAWVRRDETAPRCAQVEDLAASLAAVGRDLGAWLDSARRDRLVGRALGVPPPGVFGRIDGLRAGLYRLDGVRRSLGEAGVPAGVVDDLTRWVLAGAELYEGRLERLATFADEHRGLPFSDWVRNRHRIAFFAAARGDGLAGSPALAAWLGEIPDPTPAIS